jgi:hypothetical protein
MSWLVGESVAKSELDTHGGPERLRAFRYPGPRRRERPLAASRWEERPGGASLLSAAQLRTFCSCAAGNIL